MKMVIKPRLLGLLNTAAYLLNALETFGCGPFSSRFSADQNNAAISNKYQTIITPYGIAFAIWGLIFVMQAVFCCVCIFGNNAKAGEAKKGDSDDDKKNKEDGKFFWKGDQYCAHPLVVEGVSYYYLLACLAQTAWSPAFAYEHMPLSALCMGCILLPLIIIAVKQHSAYKRAMQWHPKQLHFFRGKYYWLLQFPFELHLGWIIAAFALNLNVALVADKASRIIQLTAALIWLIILTIASISALFKVQNYTIPSVSIWALFWIYVELHHPKELILNTFTSNDVNAFCYGSIGLVFVLSYCCVWKLFSS